MIDMKKLGAKLNVPAEIIGKDNGTAAAAEEATARELTNLLFTELLDGETHIVRLEKPTWIEESYTNSMTCYHTMKIGDIVRCIECEKGGGSVECLDKTKIERCWCRQWDEPVPAQGYCHEGVKSKQ